MQEIWYTGVMMTDSFTDTEKSIIRKASQDVLLKLSFRSGQFKHRDGWLITKSIRGILVQFWDGDSLIESRRSTTLVGLSRNLSHAWSRI
jgi:hypothetical protein